MYKGKDLQTNEIVAIKVEAAQTKKPVLKLETSVLKKLNTTTVSRLNNYFCGFRAGGTVVNQDNESQTFLVMSLAGSKFYLLIVCLT